MEHAEPADWLHKPSLGYVMNAEFSDVNEGVLARLIEDIESICGDAVFCPPLSKLHITLLDWITPLANYEERNKEALFAELQPSYDHAITEILATVHPIRVRFDVVKVSPTTVYIVGHDNGEFQSIRERFVNAVALMPNTMLPPQIIHSSLARFTKPIELEAIRAFASHRQLNLVQEISSFRLVRSTREPNLEVETIKRYELA